MTEAPQTPEPHAHSQAQLLDGRALAKHVQHNLLPNIARVVSALGRPPGLGVVLVGDHGPSTIYVRNKALAAQKLGLHSHVLKLPANIAQHELLEAIDAFNSDDTIDAFLVQLPLPPHLDAKQALGHIARHKDGDALGPSQQLGAGDGAPELLPCTPAGCLALIAQVLPDLTGLHAVVVGRSSIVGRPLAAMLLAQNATVTVCHSHTQDLARHTRMADVLIAAAGVPGLITAAHIKPGSVVIDVGIHRQVGTGGKATLVGDVDTAAALRLARAVTPVPGGVGPMTIAMLLCNAVRAAELTVLGRAPTTHTKG